MSKLNVVNRTFVVGAENTKVGSAPRVHHSSDAAKAGATFIEGFWADKVLFDTKNGKRVARGVEGTWTSRDTYLGLNGNSTVRHKVIIKAQRVVVSSAALQSPLSLLRSGLSNSHIGNNLHLHPGKPTY